MARSEINKRITELAGRVFGKGTAYFKLKSGTKPDSPYNQKPTTKSGWYYATYEKPTEEHYLGRNHGQAIANLEKMAERASQ